MRLLGQRATLETIRLDIVFLHASLLVDDRDEVKALAPAVAQLRARFTQQRAAFEAAEEAHVVAMATRLHSENKLGRVVVTLGGQLRVANRALYEVLFPHLSPSKTAHAAVDRRVVEAKRILGELEHLPADHPTRVAHHDDVAQTLAILSAAKTHQEDVDVSLALARSRLTEFKFEADAVRTTTHGKLVVITKSREEADSFFRREKDVSAHEAPPADGPAPSPTPPADPPKA